MDHLDLQPEVDIHIPEPEVITDHVAKSEVPVHVVSMKPEVPVYDIDILNQYHVTLI